MYKSWFKKFDYELFINMIHTEYSVVQPLWAIKNDEEKTKHQIKKCLDPLLPQLKIFTSYYIYTVKPAHNGQVRSQTKLTVRSRWPLRAQQLIIFFH